MLSICLDLSINMGVSIYRCGPIYLSLLDWKAASMFECLKWLKEWMAEWVNVTRRLGRQKIGGLTDRIHSYKRTQTHSNTHIHTYIRTNTNTYTYKQTYSNIVALTKKHTKTQTHAHKHFYTYVHIYKHIIIHTYKHTYKHTYVFRFTNFTNINSLENVH